MASSDNDKQPSPIERYLTTLHQRYANLDEGQVATYIPELAKADPRWFGISVVTPDGHVYEVGDTRQSFTIQSISKPFAYGLALEDRGQPGVLEKVGVEPSGEAFNSISLAPGTGRPLNPMINAGAIATTSLVRGDTAAQKVRRLLDVFSTYAGRPLGIDQAVYQSERETGHRNRAIGHMLRNFDIVTEDPTAALDAYFQQCSIEVTCRDLAVMAATLANEGVNPVTGERAIKRDLVDAVMSVMMSCGMYDYAGEWLYWVGLPAKSGVAGGIMAVLPGQLGIAVFSPRLDARGNSVRGIRVCKDLSTELDLHCLRVPRAARAGVRAVYDLGRVRSKRVRRERELRYLQDAGTRVKVCELQGDLMFGPTELAIRQIVAADAESDVVVIDLRRASRIDRSSAELLLRLSDDREARGKQILFASLQGHPNLDRLLATRAAAAETPGITPARRRAYADLDSALEHCENDLIARRFPDAGGAQAVPLGEHDLFRGLTPAAIAAVGKRLTLTRFRRGDVIVHAGEPADEIYLLTEGQVSVVVELAGGQAKRIATLSAGMFFGELAVVRRTARTADVRADTAVECYALPRRELEDLEHTDPTTRALLLGNILRHVAEMVALLTAEVTALLEA